MAAVHYGRIPIGASDYGLDRYTLAETPNDYEMNSFSIARDRQHLIPYIKAAQAVKSDIIFWASPWTPPPWMKDNNAYDRGYMKTDARPSARTPLPGPVRGGVQRRRNPTRLSHAQNEAGYPQDYTVCQWTASQWRGTSPTISGRSSSRAPSAGIWPALLTPPPTTRSARGDVERDGRQLLEGIGLQWGMVQHATTTCVTSRAR
jgi:glucosylceramidase